MRTLPAFAILLAAFAVHAVPSLDGWSTQTALPLGREDAAVAAAGQFIIVAGGSAGGVALADVSYAKVSDDGALSVWAAGPALPDARVGAAIVSTGSHLYLLGGADAAGALHAETYSLEVGASGPTGTWQAETALPVAVMNAGATIDPTLNTVIVGGGVGTDGPQRALWTTSVLSTTHLAPFQTSTSDLGAAFAQVRLHWSATTGQLLVAASDGTAFELLSGPITAGAAPTVDLGVRAPLDLDRTAFSAAGCGDALVLAQGHASSTLSTTAEALFPALGTTTADQHVQVAAPFASEHGALVQVGSYLFAIGGRDANGLDTGAVQATKAKCPQLARSLHFAAPPATIEVSSTFSIALELRDGDGQFVAPHGTPVATVVQVEGNTDVQGVSDVIFTAGRAALSNLSFNTEASGVVLLARAPLLDAASSSPFGATLSFTQTPNAAVGFGCSSTGSQAWLALWPLAMVIFANLYRRRRLPLSRPEPAVKGRTLARSSRETLGRLILVLAFAAGAARAALPTPPAAPPNKEQIAQARELNEQGTKALASGQYAAAITAFEGAYKLTGSQSMLYNLAETHRRLGHKEDAIELYRAYLLKAPKGPARADAEQMLAQMTGGAIQGTPPSTPAQPQPHAPAQAPAAPAKSSETSAPKSSETSPAKSSETSPAKSSESSPAKSSETSQKDAKKGKGGKPGKDGKADDKKAEAPAVAQPGPSQAIPAQPAAPTHATPAPTRATPAPTHATPAPAHTPPPPQPGPAHTTPAPVASQTAPVLLKTAPLLLLDGSLVYDPSGKTAGGELRFGVRALRFDGDGLVLSAGVAVARKPGLVGQASWTLFASASEDSEDSHRRFFLDALLRGRLAPIDGGLALGGGGGVQLHGWLGGPMSWLVAASFEGVHGPSGTIFTPLVLLGLRVDL